VAESPGFHLCRGQKAPHTTASAGSPPANTTDGDGLSIDQERAALKAIAAAGKLMRGMSAAAQSAT